jgi:glycosyltransferase involved in cell wall biosynthesis
VIGGVGRLSAEKGFDLLIRAVHRLRCRGFDAALILVGEGEEHARLERLAAELGLADVVRLAGQVNDPRSYYEAMDVFALSSLREGMPNVILEALAMMVPVVASRIAGVPRLIEHETNGLLVESGDVEGLTTAITCLLQDPALSRRLASAGRATVQSRFSFAERMQRLAQVYDELLGRKPAGERHGVLPATSGSVRLGSLCTC